MLYPTVVCALDLSEESDQILEHAAQLCRDKLWIIHVVEPVTSPYITTIPPVQPAGLDLSLMEDFKVKSSERLTQLVENHAIEDAEISILTGSPARTIRQFAEQQQADLIVIGTHGQHGLQLLLGSTANAVLHGACCDVLAVRVGDTK